MSEFLFYVFAAVMLLSGLMMVCSRNPVNGAMYMIMSFVGMSALFILLQAYFLAALQVLVYAGAVVVLFLFIIMLLDVDKMAGRNFMKKRQIVFPVVFLIVSFAAMFNLVYLAPTPDAAAVGVEAVAKNSLPASVPTEVSPAANSRNFGRVLFSQYVLPIQVTSFLLLVAMIGVIHLSKRRLPAGEKPASSEPLPDKPAPAPNA